MTFQYHESFGDFYCHWLIIGLSLTFCKEIEKKALLRSDTDGSQTFDDVEACIESGIYVKSSYFAYLQVIT